MAIHVVTQHFTQSTTTKPHKSIYDWIKTCTEHSSNEFNSWLLSTEKSPNCQITIPRMFVCISWRKPSKIFIFNTIAQIFMGFPQRKDLSRIFQSGHCKLCQSNPSSTVSNRVMKASLHLYIEGVNCYCKVAVHLWNSIATKSKLIHSHPKYSMKRKLHM